MNRELQIGKKTKKISTASTCLSLIILNGQNAPVKRDRVTDCIKIPFRCCLQKTYFRAKDTHTLPSKRMEKHFSANGNDRESKE